MEQQEQDISLAVDEQTAPPSRPKAMTVVGLLAASSLILSWLSSYAVAGALVSAEIIRPWQQGQDPRLKWMGISFAALMGVFGLIALLLSRVSSKEVKEIDNLSDGEQDQKGEDLLAIGPRKTVTDTQAA